MVLQRVYKDSELGAHTRDQSQRRIYFGQNHHCCKLPVISAQGFTRATYKKDGYSSQGCVLDAVQAPVEDPSASELL